jgi:hypothetical protein
LQSEERRKLSATENITQVHFHRANHSSWRQMTPVALFLLIFLLLVGLTLLLLACADNIDSLATYNDGELRRRKHARHEASSPATSLIEQEGGNEDTMV